MYDDTPRMCCPECGQTLTLTGTHFGYKWPYHYNGWRPCIMSWVPVPGLEKVRA